MGKQVHYNDQAYDVTDDETAQEFKQRVDIPGGDILTYYTDDMELPQAMEDNETFSKVPDSATIGAQAPGDQIFG